MGSTGIHSQCRGGVAGIACLSNGGRVGPAPGVDVDLYNVVVANGRFVAGGLPIAPEADPADGLLDIVLIPSRPTSEVVLLAAQILLGKHLKSDAIIFRRAAKVSVQSNPGMWFNVDGELIGNDPNYV